MTPVCHPVHLALHVWATQTLPRRRHGRASRAPKAPGRFVDCSGEALRRPGDPLPLLSISDKPGRGKGFKEAQKQAPGRGCEGYKTEGGRGEGSAERIKTWMGECERMRSGVGCGRRRGTRRGPCAGHARLASMPEGPASSDTPGPPCPQAPRIRVSSPAPKAAPAPRVSCVASPTRGYARVWRVASVASRRA